MPEVTKFIVDGAVTTVTANLAGGGNLIIINGYAVGAFVGNAANGSANANDPNTYPNGMVVEDVQIDVPVGFQFAARATFSAVASLADVYNANHSINARYTIKNCKVQLLVNGQLQLVVSMGVNDVDGYIYRIAFQIAAVQP